MIRRILPHPVSQICRLAVLASALVALGLPQAAWAQTPLGEIDEAPLRPFEVLLEHQEALGLTAEQLDRLGRIRERLGRANEQPIARMLALRQQWQQQGGAGVGRAGAQRRERIRTAAEGLRARITRNNQSAMRAVNRVLTPEQRAELRAIVQARRGDEGGRRGGPGPDASGGN